jgi:hypothetical protein
MLYLVPKVPAPQTPSAEGLSPQIKTTHPGFVSEITQISARQYMFAAQDAAHRLQCSFMLEIQDVLDAQNEALPLEDRVIPQVVGNFPAIDGELLAEEVWEDDYLQGILTIQFYLKILEALILFCEDKSAGGLVLTVDEGYIDLVDVYEDFIAGQMQVITENGEKTQIVIPANVGVYDLLIDFMDQFNRDFHRTLWRDQRQNSAIRHYLKSHAVL